MRQGVIVRAKGTHTNQHRSGIRSRAALTEQGLNHGSQTMRHLRLGESQVPLGELRIGEHTHICGRLYGGGIRISADRGRIGIRARGLRLLLRLRLNSSLLHGSQ